MNVECSIDNNIREGLLNAIYSFDEAMIANSPMFKDLKLKRKYFKL